MYYTYILRSKQDGKMYVGCTSDLRKRLMLHNLGKVISTKSRIPFEIIFYEAYKNKKDAFDREQFLKTGWGRNYIKRVLKNYFGEEFKKLGG